MRAGSLPKLLLIATMLTGGLAACGDDDKDAATPTTGSPTTGASTAPAGRNDVSIAAANFPENQILAEIYKQALEHAGYKATVTQRDTRPNILKALESDNVQVEPDYVGSLTEYYNKLANGASAKPVASGDLTATYAKAQELAGAKGLTVLTPSPAADQNAFVVTKEFSTTNGITKLSQLAAYKGKLVLGGTPECKTYSLCQPGLEGTYGITFTGFEQTDLGGTLSISKLKSGKVTLGEFLSSDGNIQTNDFVLLEDDKQLQNVDNVVPVLSKSVGADAKLVEVLNKVSASMTTADLIELNRGSSTDKKLPNQLAKEYLTKKGLLS
jgi:osmoprotectant transport system substrate-binding protein